MFLLRLFELLFTAFIILGVSTQILIPLLNGSPIFPLFRTRKVEKKLAEAHEKVEVAEIENKIEDAERQAEDLRRESSDASS